MPCNGCARKVEGALLGAPAVETATVEREPGRTVVRGGASPDELIRATEQAGFRAHLPGRDETAPA